MIETEFKYIDVTTESTTEALMEIAYQLKRMNDIAVSKERNKSR